jgi:lipopolysaccharide/colanic/teichoic acid biosynthesis glycosyltransferase
MFKRHYEHILTIRPGITDYAALEFRDEEYILNKYADANVGYIKEVLPAKIALYMQYLEKISFTTDVKIICKTVWRIVV